jgi:hypothetical protein
VAVGLPLSIEGVDSDGNGDIDSYKSSSYVNGINSVNGGPSSAAVLTGPSRVAVDEYGSLYIADTGSNKIRMMEGKCPQLSPPYCKYMLLLEVSYTNM